jgi:Kdo2-lipid IVA lauroyltransferase/acyltransferase
MFAVAWLVARLPYSALRSLGAALGFVAGSVLRIRRRQVEDALARAGIPPSGPGSRVASGAGGANGASTSSVAQGMYASLGAGLLELLWLAGRDGTALDGRFEVTPACAKALRRAARGGRGVVVATAHTGNWDLCACAAARWLTSPRGLSARARLHVVTKRLSWRSLDQMWQRLRAERGVTLVFAEGAARAVREALGRGAVVAMMVDQAPNRDGGVLAFPFLGAVARHDLGPVMLAARARAPIVVVFGSRGPDGRHILELGGVIEPASLRAPGGALDAARTIAASLERFVRARPEQWLWLHRRWKPYAAPATRVAASEQGARAKSDVGGSPPRADEAS